jgi:murein DD-endopeptidase MepM/ murein hydrolase activator NlpD
MFTKSPFFLIFFIVSFNFSCSKDSSVIKDVIINEDNIIFTESTYMNMLTPSYYVSTIANPFKNEVDQFISEVEQIQFSHPLGSSEERPNYVVKTKFGDEKGNGLATQYHPAVDVYVGNFATNVNFYATHDGYISTARDVDKYRQYVSITKNIEDKSGEFIGKLVTIYAHVDLDLDAVESLYKEGDFVSKETLISKHLYAETVGGPHLHFEVRYYRATDVGNEEFYGGYGADFTEPSAGYWEYGYWNPSVGYGYANVKNHQLFLY